MPSLSKSIPVALLVGVSGVLAAPAVTGNQEKTPCNPGCTLYDGSQRYDMCNQAFDPDYCPANMHLEDYGRLFDHCKDTMTGKKDNKQCDFDACKWLHPGHTSSPSKPTGDDKSWGSKPTGDDKSWGSKPNGDDKSWGSPSKPSHDDDDSWHDGWWQNQNDPHHDAWTPESDHHHEPAGEKPEDCGCDENVINPPHGWDANPLPLPTIPKGTTPPIDPKGTIPKGTTPPVDPKGTIPKGTTPPVDPKGTIPKGTPPVDPKGH